MIQNMRTLNGKVNWISNYTFKYFDFDELLKNVSSLTKTQMVLSSDFVGRGYHISDRDRLETKIHRLFE